MKTDGFTLVTIYSIYRQNKDTPEQVFVCVNVAKFSACKWQDLVALPM